MDDFADFFIERLEDIKASEKPNSKER